MDNRLRTRPSAARHGDAVSSLRKLQPLPWQQGRALCHEPWLCPTKIKIDNHKSKTNARAASK